LNAKEKDQARAYIVLVDSKNTLDDTFFTLTKRNTLTISGGRAGLFDQEQSWVLHQDTLYQDRSVAVGIICPKLTQQRDVFVDSIAIGRRMRITACEGNIVKQNDHLPAQKVYQRYLNNGEKIDLAVANKFALTTVQNNIEVNAIQQQWHNDGAIVMREALPEGAWVKLLYYNHAN